MTPDRPPARTYPPTFAITQIGPVAANLALPQENALPASLLSALNQHPATSGRITAVYDRAFYIDAGDGRFLCIGTPEIGNGPITAIATGLDEGDWRAVGISVGQAVKFEASGITIADVLRLDVASALRWQPRPWPTPIVPATLARSIADLHEHLSHRAAPPNNSPVRQAKRAADRGVPRDSLSRAVERRATLAISTLADWLEYHVNGSAELDDAGRDAVASLIGLGQGLTPSGDDLISGLLMALHATGCTESATTLAAFVRATSMDATNPLSRWLLEAAIAGHPSEAMRQMLEALLTGDKAALPAAYARLQSIGHTSGIDMLAGSLLGLSAVATR